MTSVVPLAVLLGLDSFRASLGLGASGNPAAGGCVALAFGVCDGAALIVGSVAFRSLALDASWLDSIGIAALCAYAALAVVPRRGAPLSRATLLGLPLALSFDNLLVGGAVGAAGIPLALVLAGAAASAGMSLAGYRLGARIGRAVPARLQGLAASLLFTFALALSITVA